MKAKIVRVEFKKGKSGLIFASSPDLKGLLVSERTMEALDNTISAAITDLYAACGLKVLVTKAETEEGGATPWVAFPAELARRALEDSSTSH